MVEASKMLIGAALVAAVTLLNTIGRRYVPSKLRVFIPSVGWFLINVSIARGEFVWYACSLAIQGLFATLLFMTLGFKSDLVSRAIIFPFLVTAMAGWAKEVLPPIGKTATLALTAVQVWEVISGIVLLACYPACIMQVLEQQDARNRRVRAVARTLMRKKDKNVDVRLVPALDGKHELQTLVIRQGAETTRWCVYCGGNAEFLENTINDIHVISDAIKANVVLFNPRGIGYSTGNVSRLEDFVEDTVAVAKDYIAKEKIEEKNLLFFGHSIGAGAAAQAVGNHFPQASLVVDRSFSSMADAAVPFSYLTPNATRKVFPLCVGKLDTVAGWDKIKHNRKLLLYAKEDEIIKYDISSAARLPQFQKDGADASKVVELLGAPPSYHNSLLSAFENYEEVSNRMNKLFSA